MEYKALGTDRDKSSIVHCQPERASLINPPEFCTLSYCWGDPKITTGVINDIPVQVTINLESALRHLKANGISVLWVDAVCINQQTEKNQQLLWMGSIYRRVQEVHTWVGEEDDDFNEAFLSTSTTSDSNMQGGAPALVQFLDRPYWTRVRIIQELANARKTTIHCGPHDMDWERLATTVSETNDFVKSSTSVVNFRNLRRFRLTAARLHLLRMIDALLRSRSVVSTEPRDKVFALLNLVYDGGLYLPIPNYKQSIKDLCMSMTLSGIATTSRLDILPLLGVGYDNGNKKTLVFQAGNELVRIGEETIRGATYFFASDKTGLNHGPRLGAPSVLQSFGVKQTMGPVSMAADVLKVEGLVLDEVDGFCPTYQEVSSGSIAPPSSQSDGDAVAYDPEKTFEATTKTINRYNVIRPRTPWVGLMFSLQELKLEDSLSKPVACWIHAVETFLLGRQSLKQLAGDRDRGLLMAQGLAKSSFRVLQGPHRGESELVIVLDDNIVGDLWQALNDNMRFMSTGNGYVGWLHPRCREGDKICILKGCSVPTILRARDEGGFVLVGDAYVQGIMEGELFAAGSDRISGLEWETLPIH